MTALYKLTEQYARLLEAGDHDPDTGEVMDERDFTYLMRELEDSIDAKAQSCAVVLRQLEAGAALMREEEKRLAARRKAVENNVESLKTYVRQCLELAGLKQAKGPLFTVSITKPRKSVNVTDLAALPGEFTVVTVTAKKKEIGDALKEGRDVPGAELVDGEPGLSIR